MQHSLHSAVTLWHRMPGLPMIVGECTNIIEISFVRLFEGGEANIVSSGMSQRTRCIRKAGGLCDNGDFFSSTSKGNSKEAVTTLQ